MVAPTSEKHLVSNKELICEKLLKIYEIKLSERLCEGDGNGNGKR